MGISTTTTPPVWTVDTNEKQSVLKGKKNPRDKKVFSEWEVTVTKNPYRSDDGKIRKVKTTDRTYRWKKPPYRIIYDVYSEEHTIYPLEFETRGNVKSYK